MLAGVARGHADIEAVHQATPLCVLNPPPEVRNNSAFLTTNGVRILILGNPTYAIAVKVIYDALKHLEEGTALEERKELQDPLDLLRAVKHTAEFITRWPRGRGTNAGSFSSSSQARV
jgi:hypothetical protein